jgi:Kef-type K+ transport system membrane component KefB
MRRSSLLLYAVMLAAAVALFLLVRARGEVLTAPEATEPAGHAVARKGDALLQVLIALSAVVAGGVLLGRLFGYLGQPAVIGEVVAGILLGPSLLGREGSAVILPDAVAPYLGVIAQLGVILYMFVVGLELDPGQLRGRVHATAVTSHASIVVPFMLGSSLALLLYPVLSHRGVPFTSFALFMGVAMSITAFPVLARILSDRGLEKTELGVLALSCAAINDVTAWCLLAFVVGVTQAQVAGALMVCTLSLGFLAVMFVAVRPLARLFVRRCEEGPLTRGQVAKVLVAVLLSALATEAIGIHAIFGAFLLGAIVTHDSRVAREIGHRLHDVVTVLLLPAFFAYTGMRTQIGLVSGAGQWLLCGAIIVVATAGKFGGTLVAARLTGFDWRTAASLGLLMNTRGLMELIALNIGLDLGVISPALFAMMVLMALVTTMATTPLLQLFTPGALGAASAEPRVAEPPGTASRR